MKQIKLVSTEFFKAKCYLIITAAFTVLCLLSCSKRAGKPRILVFSKTAAFHHTSIPNGIAAIEKLGAENNFAVDTTTDASYFNDDSLKNYSAVVFLSTTGNVLDYRQEVAFERYIQAGGGYVGVHSATDTEYDWGWYGRLVGAYFTNHPDQQEAVLNIVDTGNMATKHLPHQWKRKDEWYNFKKISPDIHVLITIDEKSYKGGTNGSFHPMAWYHEYDGGRSFYTEPGHTEELYADPLFVKHLLGGIEYAIGNNTTLDYAKAKSAYPPEEDRFTKTMLVQGTFFEPTEMTVLPNLDILVLQRRGEIMRYSHETKNVKQVGFLNVYWKTQHTPGVNAEEGMLGLSKDPNFAKNNWIYIYYSPFDSSVNRLSRFTFKNDTIDYASEKTILEVKAQREICCHTGGSIAFGSDGLLYVSSGDNSTPFDEPKAKFVSHSFAPLNDIPGHMQYDARRSAGNTNDLRGKILRIRVNEDGTYEIPNGNLFPKGTDKTRPEIYVMGDRNPYRISVDQKNNYLYWGEVGPDANNDSMDTRGPRGYDEVNQARKAGYFGWPLFVGNNFAYRQYDYATGKSGAAFDPAHPVNNSRNNTGLTNLPPAQPAFIWYPYDVSPDFPQVGAGGRNAMAGPVYYMDMWPKEGRLPDYYNKKLIIYDWIRGWMKAVTMLPNGDFDKMEPFMEHTKLNNCIDMELGPDGKLYLLEYGSGWYTKNPDAGLARIDYNGGNIAPKITALTVNKTAGNLPLPVKATVSARDPEKEKLTYSWDFGNGAKKETNTPEADYTYTTAGDYKITVDVKDAQGAVTRSDAFGVYAGNEEPKVSIQLNGGNKSFFLPGKPINYSVTVKDSDTSKIDPANLFVSVNYPEGYDKAGVPMGHQQGAATISGKSLMLSLDCKSCHKEAEKSVGPAYTAVAQKYQKDPNAMEYLTQKIIKGGSGVWGEVAMPAHPALSSSDASQIVTWVLSLGNKAAVKKSLPPTGTITPAATKPGAYMLLAASYTDKGGNNIKALTGQSAVVLRSSTISFTGTEKLQGFTSKKSNGINLMLLPQNGGSFALDSIDLTGVASATLAAEWQNAPTIPIALQVRLDNSAGKVIGQGSLLAKPGQKMGAINIPLSQITDKQFHTIYFVYKAVNTSQTMQVGITNVQFK